MPHRGEVPERLNGPVLKTGGRKSRGFESHPLRQHSLAAIVVLVLPLLLAAVVVGACSLVPGRQFPFGFLENGAAPELQGVLNDKTGAVVRVTTIQHMEPPPPIDGG